MKRKVKKYAGGNLVDSSGNPVRSGSGEPVRTRYGKDDEDRPRSSGVEDYATLGKRAGAVSTMSGPKEYITDSSKEDTYKEPESSSAPFANFKSNESKFERNDNEVVEKKKPAAKKKDPAYKEKDPSKILESAAKSKSMYEDTGAKIGSQGNFNIDIPKDTSRGLRLAPGSIAEKIANKVSGALDRSQQVGTNAMKESARQARVDRLRRNVGSNQELYGMKKGGKVSSASSRGDGIAQRGKTRGKMC